MTGTVFDCFGVNFALAVYEVCYWIAPRFMGWLCR